MYSCILEKTQQQYRDNAGKISTAKWGQSKPKHQKYSSTSISHNYSSNSISQKYSSSIYTYNGLYLTINLSSIYISQLI